MEGRDKMCCLVNRQAREIQRPASSYTSIYSYSAYSYSLPPAQRLDDAFVTKKLTPLSNRLPTSHMGCVQAGSGNRGEAQRQVLIGKNQRNHSHSQAVQ